MNFWNEPIFASDCTTVLGKSELETKYIFNFLKANQEKVFELQKGAAQPHVYPDDLSKLLIPNADENTQNSIVEECEKIGSECENAKSEIENCKRLIEELFESSQRNATLNYKLSNKDVFDISIGRRILSTEINDGFDIPVYSANVFEPFGKINKLLLKEFDRPSVIWGIDGDWMVNVIPAGQKFYPTDHCGVLRIKNGQLEEKYVAWVFNKEGKSAGFRREYRAAIDRIIGLSIKLPPLSEQKKIVAKVSVLEQKISAAKSVIENCPARKSAALKNWLE